MRIFKQAFQQLGSASKPSTSQQKHNNSFISADEYFKEKSQQPLTRQFFTQLSSFESKVLKNCTFELVNQLVSMYQQCIEYYDGRRDDIKYYFVDKIQNIVLDLQNLKKLKNELEVPQIIKPSLSPTTVQPAVSPVQDTSEYVRMKKREKSVKTTISQRVLTETEQSTPFMGDLVTEYHDNLDKYQLKVKHIVETQTKDIQERLRRRSLNRKHMSRSYTQNLEDSFGD